jgi:hypothetical protein
MKIGVNLVGISQGIRDRNWKDSLDNIKNNVINCWDYEPKIYLTTYQHESTFDLLKDYTPTKYLFLPFQNSDQRLTYKNSLIELLNEDIDLIISIRFDIQFTNALSSYKIDFDKFNFLFKESGGWWQAHKFTCDNLFIFPKKYLRATIDSIQEFYDHPVRNHSDLHPLYSHIVPKINEENINFIFDETYSSTHNPFYKLLRN